MKKPGIRVGGARDLDALVELENRAFDADRLSARQWRRHLASRSARVLVADDGRRALAAAVVFFRASSRVARLYSIAVAAEARGLGLGRAMLAAAERSARARGCRAMRLEVRTDNCGAVRLYERAGYVRIGTKAHYYEDGADAIRYEKVLAGRRRSIPAT